MMTPNYATIFSPLLEKYIDSPRNSGTKWWGFMKELEILQLSYMLCNIPYYPDEAKAFFSNKTKSQYPGYVRARTRKQYADEVQEPLFISATLKAPKNQNTFPYCAYLMVKDVLFVCVRGTTLTQDWAVNANALMNDSGLFHKGFYDNAHSGIVQMQKVVEKKKLTFSKVVFAGHSMGAATASIMSYLYKKGHPDMKVESLVLSCPKFSDRVIGEKKWSDTVPHSLHMYTDGDVTPTITVGFLGRPFAKTNEVKLCLPVAISKTEYGTSSHLMYIGTALHKNYYNNNTNTKNANNIIDGYFAYNTQVPPNSSLEVLQAPKNIEFRDTLFAMYTGTSAQNAIAVFPSYRYSSVTTLGVSTAAAIPGDNVIISFATSITDGTTLFYTLEE
jgi:hypothetical protein